MRRYVVLLVLAVLVLAGCGESIKSKVTLQWKWEAGKVCKYRMTQDMEQLMKGTPQGNMKTLTHQEMVAIQEVIEVDEQGIATITLDYESIKLDAANPAIGRMTFDSANESDMAQAQGNPELASMVAMLDHTFTIRITQSGEVIGLKGFDEMMDDVMGDASDDPMFDQLKDSFSDESRKKIMQQAYAQFPKEELTTGDFWETSIEIPLPPLMNIKVKGKNTYKGNKTVAGRKCARIDSRMEMNLVMDPDSPVSQRLDMEWEPAEGNTVIYFDAGEGILVQQQAKIRMRGVLTARTGESVNIDRTMTMKVELIE